MSDLVSHDVNGSESGGWIGLTVLVHHAHLADDAVVHIRAHTSYSSQTYEYSNY